MSRRTYGGPLVDIAGAIDLHCHPYPDLFPRLADDFDIVRAARDAGMRAIMLKCHHESTVSRAYLVQRVVPGIRVYGGIVLNFYVGGLNPAAVEASLRLGGKEVWMPTVDAGYHAEVHGGTGGYDSQQGGRSQAEGIWVDRQGGQAAAGGEGGARAGRRARGDPRYLSPGASRDRGAGARGTLGRGREDRRHASLLPGPQPGPRHPGRGGQAGRHARVRLLHGVASLAVRLRGQDRREHRPDRRLALPARLGHGPAAQPAAVGGPADLRADGLREGRPAGAGHADDHREPAGAARCGRRPGADRRGSGLGPRPGGGSVRGHPGAPG